MTSLDSWSDVLYNTIVGVEQLPRKAVPLFSTCIIQILAVCLLTKSLCMFLYLVGNVPYKFVMIV